MPLAKNVLAPLGLTAALSAIDGSIQNKIHDSGVKLIIEQEDMNDIMKIIKALESSSILLKGVSKTIKNETKEQRGGFLSMLLGTLGASLLGNLLTGGFLLAGDKFMPEMHLRQPRFVYSACGPFTKHKERIKEFKRTGDTRYIYRNELDKACFQHDSAYTDHKDLINRTEADKVLRDKAYDIASNPEYDGYQIGFASMAYKFFDEKSMAEPNSLERTGSGFKKLKNTAEPSALARSSSILADERHKPIIRKFNKRKVYS